MSFITNTSVFYGVILFLLQTDEFGEQKSMKCRAETGKGEK